METITIKKSSYKSWEECIDIPDARNIFMKGLKNINGSRVTYYFGQFIYNCENMPFFKQGDSHQRTRIYTIQFNTKSWKYEMTVESTFRGAMGSCFNVQNFINDMEEQQYELITRAEFVEVYKDFLTQFPLCADILKEAE